MRYNELVPATEQRFQQIIASRKWISVPARVSVYDLEKTDTIPCDFSVTMYHIFLYLLKLNTYHHQDVVLAENEEGSVLYLARFTTQNIGEMAGKRVNLFKTAKDKFGGRGLISSVGIYPVGGSFSFSNEYDGVPLKDSPDPLEAALLQILASKLAREVESL